MKDVKPTPEGESAKVKVKVRVNLHGILTISSASLVEKLPASENEINDEQPMEASPSPAADSVNGMESEPISPEVKTGSKRSLLMDDLASDANKLFKWFHGLVCSIFKLYLSDATG